MKSDFRIRYLKTAEKDLDDIFDYVLKDKPMAAAALLERFDRFISGLAVHPELGVIPKDERLQRLGYRMLIVDNYLVLYIVQHKTTQIRRILHGTRQYRFLME